jgi:hypothetical protein
MEGSIFLVAIVLGLIPAAIASAKGHQFISWWVFGALLFIVALPMAIVLKPRDTTQPPVQQAEPEWVVRRRQEAEERKRKREQ